MKPWSANAKLAVAAVVAAVSVTAAIVTVTQDRSTTVKKITASSASAPGLAWTADVSQVGLDGAVFADPRTGSIYPYGAGAIRLGDMALALAVVTEDLGASDAVMVGIDLTDGSVKWTTPATDLASCADEPLDGNLVCHQPTYGATPGLVTFDPRTGQSRAFPTDLDLFAMTVANDRVYVTSGNLEDDDVLLHRGSVEEPDADWSVPVHADAGWEDYYVDKLTVGKEVGTFDVGGDFSTFDSSTGEQIWETELLRDCLLAVNRTAGGLAVASTFDCDGSSSDVTGSVAFRQDGTILARSSNSAVQNPQFDSPTDTSVPVILGDTAFDRSTGQPLWSNESLVYDSPGDEWNEPRTVAALTAVVGDVGLLRSNDGTRALNLRTGDQLWQDELDGSVFGLDDRSILMSSGSDLTAIDVATGETVWTASWSMMLPNSGAGSLDILVDNDDGRYLLQSGSTLAMLQPLP